MSPCGFTTTRPTWLLTTNLSPHARSIAFDVLLFFFVPAASLRGHAFMNADRFLSSRLVGSVEQSVACPPLSSWVIATDGSATLATDLSPAIAGWGSCCSKGWVLEGLEWECWGEVLLDERDPRSLCADFFFSLSLSNNAGEFWAFLAEALLWLRNESHDSGRVPVFTTQKWPRVGDRTMGTPSFTSGFS